jgi:hypothetical protein
MEQIASMDSPLFQALGTFCQNLTALRGFVALIASVLETHRKITYAESADMLMACAIAMKDALPDLKMELPADKIAKVRQEFGGEVKLAARDDMYTLEFTPGMEKRLLRGMTALYNASAHHSLLYRSALISLVSAAEWLVAQLIRAYIVKHPNSAGIKDKTMTLSDLQELGSIEDAQNMLIQARIDELMFGSLDDWLKFLHSTMRLSMGYWDKRMDALVEIFQRRNVMVHNNGIVGSSYVKKVAPELREGLDVNASLLIKPEYLEGAIDLVEYSFLLISAELWQDLDFADEMRAALLSTIVIERINSERWLVAEGASEFVMRDKKLSERSQLIGKINYWQVLKWQKRFDEVRKNVEETDFSAKGAIYQLARLVLLDRTDEAFTLLPKVVKNEELSVEQLREWPLFREFRKDERVEKFIATGAANQTVKVEGPQVDLSKPVVQ